MKTARIFASKRNTPLAASAIVLAALLIVQLGRICSTSPLAPDIPFSALPALAEMSSVGTDFSMLTTMGGNNEEILYILDNRAGRLFVYEPAGGGNIGLQHVDTVDIAEAVGRIAPAGGGPEGQKGD